MNKSFFCILVAIQLFLSPLVVMAEEVKVDDSKPAILQASANAVALLNKRLSDQPKHDPIVVSSKKIPLKVVLATWNEESGAFNYIEGVINKDRFEQTTEFDHKIKLISSNGVNSNFEALDGKSQVVAMIHPTFFEVAAKGKVKQYELRNKVYVPYSAAFYKPQVIAEGSKYLSELVDDAVKELREKQFKSRAFPDRLLVDVIDPYLVKSIAIIEHSDSRIYGDSEPERAMGKFLAILAANGENSFDFSVSSAGARGLVQFMPKTYAGIRRVWPEMNLISDFQTGMADHTNAMKAQFALLDYELAMMPKDIKAMYLQNHTTASGFLAAAYNGGGSRVRKAWKQFAESWAENKLPLLDQLQAKANSMDARMKQLKKYLAQSGLSDKKRAEYKKELRSLEAERPAVRAAYRSTDASRLRSETVKYVTKLGRVYQMLTGGYFAPNTTQNPSEPSSDVIAFDSL